MRYVVDMVVWSVFGWFACAVYDDKPVVIAPATIFAIMITTAIHQAVRKMAIEKAEVERDAMRVERDTAQNALNTVVDDMRKKIMLYIDRPLSAWYNGNDRSEEPHGVDVEKLTLKLGTKRDMPK